MKEFAKPADATELEGFVAGAEIYSLGRIAAELAPGPGFPARGYRHSDLEQWKEVAVHLEEVGEDGEVESQAVHQPPTVPENSVLWTETIPVTRLRQFYLTLQLLKEDAVHSSIANRISRDADRADILDTLFRQSLAHLSRYHSSEPFHPGRRDWFVSYATRPEKFARCLVANLAPGSGRPALVEMAEDPGNSYRVVDYEVSPLRTTGGRVFEDGRPGSSSGAGGIDLLMAAADGTPVIAEIKAPGDGSLFSALVQALTYAAELLGQGSRLRDTYPEPFEKGEDDVCEILILVKKKDRPRLGTETKRIMKLLMAKEDGAIARHVRRFSIVKASLDDAGPPRFRLRHTEKSVRWSPAPQE